MRESCDNGNTKPVIPIKEVFFFSLPPFLHCSKVFNSESERIGTQPAPLRKGEFHMIDPEIEQDSHKELPCTLGSGLFQGEKNN